MQPGQTIGDWTEQKLIRFVENIQQQRPATGVNSFTADTLKVVKRLACVDQFQLMQSQVTVGGAGSAATLPATPSGYFQIYDQTGGVFVIPYYKAS